MAYINYLTIFILFSGSMSQNPMPFSGHQTPNPTATHYLGNHVHEKTLSILGWNISTNENEDMKTLLSNGHSFIIFHFLHDEIISYQSDHYTVRIS